jgi:hypothetical protein
MNDSEKNTFMSIDMRRTKIEKHGHDIMEKNGNIQQISS